MEKLTKEKIYAGNTQLKTGYSSGMYAAAALSFALKCLSNELHPKILQSHWVTLALPKSQKKIQIDCFVAHKKGNCLSAAFSVKGNNDDHDVTQGAKITCFLFAQKPASFISRYQKFPHNIKEANNILFVHAGHGLGVANLTGLRVAVGFPAITEGPLSVIKKVFQDFIAKQRMEVLPEIHALFEVEKGEKISLKTVNAKVGVLGGISFLGSRGIVKPLSTQAYLKSIETEISVAFGSGQEKVYFVLGNKALSLVKEKWQVKEVAVIESGNYVWESIMMLNNTNIKEVVFLTGIAKMARVALGYKNTHSQCGILSTNELLQWCKEHTPQIKLDGNEINSVRDLNQKLFQEHEALSSVLSKIILQKAWKNIATWWKKTCQNNLDIELVLLDSHEQVHRFRKEIVC